MFDFVERLYFKLYKRTLNCEGLFINFRKWTKYKNATKKPKYKNKEFLKYASLATLHHQEILNHRERISSLKPLANQYS